MTRITRIVIRGSIREISEIRVRYLLEAVVLEGGVVVGVHVVDADDGGAREVVEEALDKVAADETGCAGDEDGFTT